MKKKLLCDGHNDCEDGSDEIGCILKNGNGTICESDEFLCVTEQKCIGMDKVCDANDDCRGREDEKNCPICSEFQFRCHNDECIPLSDLCDGFATCSDGSDEVNCKADNGANVPASTCTREEFQCRDSECIDFSLVCNHRKDCADGSDEGERCDIVCFDTKCDQECQATPNGAICSCRDGFKLAPNKKSCVDIDECKASDPCSQKCSNVNGTFTCSCSSGFMLGTDGRFCNALGPPAIFYYMLDDTIKNFTMKTMPKTKDVTVETRNININDFDVDMRRNIMYFSTIANPNLHEMNLQTGEMRIIDEVNDVKKIALDWINGNIYVVEIGSEQIIKVCTVAQRMCVPLKQIDLHSFVSAIAVDPVNKYVFYVQVFESTSVRGFETAPVSSIHRMRLDGSDDKEIHKSDTVFALTLDIQQKRIYFTESSTQSLLALDYDGDSTQTFRTNNRYLREPISINVFENVAYIVNRRSSEITQCKLFGSRDCHQINLMAMGMSKIVIAQESRQQPMVSMCAEHSCDAICIPADTNVKFLKRDGSEEQLERCQPDGTTLVSEADFFRMFVSHAVIVEST